MTSALFFEERNVGKRLKFTKKRYTWKFEIDNCEFVIDLFVSRVSGKKKILVNGDIKVETSNPMPLGSCFPLRYGNHKIQVIATGENSFDLRIDSQSFISMLKKSESKHKPYKSYSDFGMNQSSSDFSSYDVNELDSSEDTSSSNSIFGTSWQKHAKPFQPKSDVWEDYSSDESKLTDTSNLPNKLTSTQFEHIPQPKPQHRKLKSVIEPEIKPTSKSMYPSFEDITPAINQLPSNIHTETYSIPAVRPSQLPKPTDPFPSSLESIPESQSNPKLALDIRAAVPSTTPFPSTAPFPSTTPFPSTPASITNAKVNPFDTPTKENTLLTSDDKQSDLTSKIVDLDSLHMGDLYSPAMVRKYEQENKPPSIQGAANLPMNQYFTSAPSSSPINSMNSNSMAMLAFNQYMTNMLIARNMMNPHNHR